MLENHREDKVGGIILSPTKIEEFPFIPLSNNLRKGSYCSFLHPLNQTLVLSRIYGGRTLNPEMLPLGIGAILAKYHVELGKEQEVITLEAEALGYLNESGAYCYPDFSASPGSKVFEVDNELIKKFFKKGSGVWIKVGIDPYSGLSLPMGLDELINGHMAVCGMTRSGKSTFVLTLIKEGLKQGCCFLIFDRTGEYQGALEEYQKTLKEAFLEIIDPLQFQALKPMSFSQIASFLKIGDKRSAEKTLINTVYDLIQQGKAHILESTADLLRECEKNLATQKDKQRITAEVKNLIERRSNLLEKLSKKPLAAESIITYLEPKKAIIIELFREKEIREQQILVASILRELSAFATETRGEAKTCLVVIEEAQFYAPEMTVFSIGDPKNTGSLETLTNCLSQLGGYNIGFIIITQRPAYVSKSILSQCNTFLVFRMKSHADHDQIASITGLPSYRISSLLSNLQDHVGYLTGRASPFEFPTFITVQERLYPQKATLTPSQVLEKMKKTNLKAPYGLRYNSRKGALHLLWSR